MNWLIPTYYRNSSYINIKCPHCGNEVILNQNIKSNDGKIKLINLDHSQHNCSNQRLFLKENYFKISYNGDSD